MSSKKATRRSIGLPHQGKHPLWMVAKSISHHLRNPGFSWLRNPAPPTKPWDNDCKYRNKQWFPAGFLGGANWIPSIHPQAPPRFPLRRNRLRRKETETCRGAGPPGQHVAQVVQARRPQSHGVQRSAWRVSGVGWVGWVGWVRGPSESLAQTPGTKMVGIPEPWQELRRRPQLFMVGIAPY